LTAQSSNKVHCPIRKDIEVENLRSSTATKDDGGHKYENCNQTFKKKYTSL